MITDDPGRAIDALKAGRIVAFPTETVYGLGADALDESRVRAIFRIKGRPSTNPLIVHVADIDMARTLTPAWSDAAERVATAFWPGPVTLVLERAGQIPDIVTAGGPTVGMRCPDHDLAGALIRGYGSPLVGPSANRSGRISPTSAAHVDAEFGQDVLILDGGPCATGIESTVVSLASRPFRVLRRGVIGATALSRVTGEIVEEGSHTVTTGPALSPGLLERHYAPRTRCILVDGFDDLGDTRVCAICHALSPPGVAKLITLPQAADAYARELYGALRTADASGVELIAIERPPLDGTDEAESTIWASIADRLRRATS